MRNRYYDDTCIFPPLRAIVVATIASSEASMSRVGRFVVPDLPHHVTERGNRRENVFFGDDWSSNSPRA